MSEKSPATKTLIQISQDLPQFKNDNALFIVTGRQTLEFYIAKDSMFKKIKSFRITHPEYSDKEGHFMVRGGGKVFGQGSVFEHPKKVMELEFEKKFNEELKGVYLKSNPNKIYIFSPIVKRILDLMSRDIRSKVVFTFDKDYSHEHPFKILEAVKKLK